MQRVWKKIVVFGDSLTQFGWSYDGGWLAMLSDKYQRRFDVVSRGFSGYNSRWCSVILPQLYDRSNVSDVFLFTIFLGANDSNDERNTKQHVPRAEFEHNLSSMVTYLLSIGLSKSQILLISAPPCDEETWAKAMLEKGSEQTKSIQLCEKYAETCKSVADNIGVNILDLYSLMVAQENWREMLCDGLHLSRSGSEFLACALSRMVDTMALGDPQQLVTAEHYPLWHLVDNERPWQQLI